MFKIPNPDEKLISKEVTFEKVNEKIEEVTTTTYQRRRVVSTEEIDAEIASLPDRLSDLENKKAQIEAVK